jgi:anti-sigma factor RsiW
MGETNHLGEGALQALLDGELSDFEGSQVRRHLAGCDACASSYEQMKEANAALTAALALLETPGRARPPLVRPGKAARAWGRSALPRAAAVLLVGFAAAASATIPGSPVREWLAARVEPPTLAVAVPDERSVQAEATALAVETAAEWGVSVEPAAGRVRVVLTDPSPELQVRALLASGSSAGVFATGDQAGTRFSTGAGTIEVIGAGAGEMRIEIPRSARSASIEVDGRTYLVKEGDQLRLAIDPSSRADAEIVFRVQP